MKKRTGLAPLIAIAVILLGLSVGSFFLTPDRAFSENENRYLQLTPKLSWDTVMSGDFMEDMEEYTSDQIVFRDLWTATRSLLQRAEGKKDISGTYLGAEGRYFAKSPASVPPGRRTGSPRRSADRSCRRPCWRPRSRASRSCR